MSHAGGRKIMYACTQVYLQRLLLSLVAEARARQSLFFSFLFRTQCRNLNRHNRLAGVKGALPRKKQHDRTSNKQKQKKGHFPPSGHGYGVPTQTHTLRCVDEHTKKTGKKHTTEMTRTHRRSVQSHRHTHTLNREEKKHYEHCFAPQNDQS